MNTCKLKKIQNLYDLVVCVAPTSVYRSVYLKVQMPTRFRPVFPKTGLKRNLFSLVKQGAAAHVVGRYSTQMPVGGFGGFAAAAGALNVAFLD